MLKAGNRSIELVEGDITRIPVDAIVNAANSQLAGGGGVDGAIHEAAGPTLMRELDGIRARIGRCDTGDAVVTGAGKLPAKYVFHAVGPIYRNGSHGEPALLASCYEKCLALAIQHGVHSISFPSISTGVYGYPIAEAAAIAIRTVWTFLNNRPDATLQVKLVQFSQRDSTAYREQALRLQAEVPGR